MDERGEIKRVLMERELWRRGNLSWKLYPHQFALYDALWKAIRDPECLKYVLKCARRFGKSTVVCLIATEFGLQFPDSQIRFAAPTAKALKKITHPIMRMITKDAPLDCKPMYRTQDNIWVFPEGYRSEIHCAGTDNGNAESLRGTAANLNLVDEAGFCDDLHYVITDILMPQTLTTDGTTLLASSPAKTPAHDFTHISQECEAAGNQSRFNVFDNKSLTPEKIELYAKESGGVNSSTWKREYLCQDVVDEDSAIIPEWRDEYVKTPERNEFYRFYHKYIGMDLGRTDHTALIYGYWDFKRAKLVIQDESTMHGPAWTTLTLKNEIKSKERELWPADNGDEPEVFRRVSDNNNPHLITDLSSLHQVYFIETTKESLEAMVNEVREWVKPGMLEVDPKCKLLIGCLKYGVWDEKRAKFARSKVYGHFDHLAALIYLIRNVSRSSNPIPANYGHEPHRSWIPKKESNNAQQLKRALLGKRQSS